MDVKQFDPKQLERLAQKNRDASRKRYEEETKQPSVGASKKRREELASQRPDPRYEGADRLHKEMKKRDR
jgi:hypothetical protein